jgi:hypothetical protein
LATKLKAVLKTTAMELSYIDIAPPTWHASCQCLVPTTHYGVYHVVFLGGRRGRSQLDGSCEGTTENDGLYRFGPLERVIPYVLLVCGCVLPGDWRLHRVQKVEDGDAIQVSPIFVGAPPQPYSRPSRDYTHDTVHDLRPPAFARVMPSIPVVSESSGDLHVLYMRNAA